MGSKEQIWKRRNMFLAEEAFEILAAYDNVIIQLSEHHFRINDRLDVWPSTKKYYDLKSHIKGDYGDLVGFVMTWFQEHEKSTRS